MPSSRSTEALLEQLVRDASPVRLSPPLRRALGGCALTWLATAGTYVALGPWQTSALTVVFAQGEALLVCAGLAAIGAGSTLYGLATSLPGREGAARIGIASGALGCAGIVAAALGGSFAPATQTYQLHPLPWDAACVAFAALAALPVAAASTWLCRRGAVLYSSAAAAGLALGSLALGAVLLQVLCAEGSARHTFASHVLAPALAVPALAVALGVVLRRARAA